MPDAEKATLKRVSALVTELREVQAREYAITEEIQALLSGGEPWDVILKRLEAAFDVAWCSRYAPGKAKQYSWNFRVDRHQMKRFHGAYGEVDLIDRFGIYVKNSEEFFVRARHSFGAFVSSINQHVPERRQVERRKWTCPHRPACGSESKCEQLQVMNQGRRDRGQPLLVEEL